MIEENAVSSNFVGISFCQQLVCEGSDSVVSNNFVFRCCCTCTSLCVSRSCWRSHLAVLSVLVIVCETSVHYTVCSIQCTTLGNYAQMFKMCLKRNVMKDLCLMAAPKTTKDPPKCWCIRLLVLGNTKNQVSILLIPDMRVVVSSTGIGDAVPQQNKYLCNGWYHDPKHLSNPKLLVLKTTWHWKLKCAFILYCVFAGYCWGRHCNGNWTAQVSKNYASEISWLRFRRTNPVPQMAKALLLSIHLL